MRPHISAPKFTRENVRKLDVLHVVLCHAVPLSLPHLILLFLQSDDIGEDISEILGSDDDVLEDVDTSKFIEVILLI